MRREALIHELGAGRIAVWLGKAGVVEHAMTEIAMIVISLEPLGESSAVEDIASRLHDEGVLAPPTDLDLNDW